MSARRPVIGVCARRAPVVLQGGDVTVSLALQAHVDLLAAAGCAPVLLPLLPDAWRLAERLDGLLVPGGPDVEPSLYGAAAHPATRASDPAADSAELELVATAIGAGLPVLAICRGMQLLNVQRGGTLHQHLPEVTGDDRHRPAAPGALGRQPLLLEPGSAIAKILGAGGPGDTGDTGDTLESACSHHQAVDLLGEGLRATGRTPDGVVEAVELEDHPFVLGVQWEAGQTEDGRLHHALAEAAHAA